MLFGVVGRRRVVGGRVLFLTGKAYDQIGKGGFFATRRGAAAAAPAAAVDIAERDDEIRQMLDGPQRPRGPRRGEAPSTSRRSWRG